MYNRYLNQDSGPAGAAPEPSAAPVGTASENPSAPPQDAAPVEEKQSRLNSLKNLFSNNLKLPELNADTLILVVLIYFLVADRDEESNTSDTLLIIGALLLLGL